MTIERLRVIIADMMMIASDDIRRAREDGDDEQAEYIGVERDTLFQLLSIIDADRGEP